MKDLEYFNSMMVSIDSGLFDVRMLIAKFLFELLETLEGRNYTGEFRVPCFMGDDYRIITVTRVYLERNGGGIFLEYMEEEVPLAWDDLDAGTQYTASSMVYNRVISDSLYRGSDKGS